MLSITCWLVLKLGMPFSSRPLVTVVTKSCFDSVFRLLISEGPTRPSWFGPWQRSQAAARQVRKPSIVPASTLLPSVTLYSAPPAAPSAAACPAAEAPPAAAAAEAPAAAGLAAACVPPAGAEAAPAAPPAIAAF